MATTRSDQPGRASRWLLLWSVGFLVGGLALGAWLRGSFGDTLQLVLLVLALLYAATALFLWRRHRHGDAVPGGRPSQWLRRWQTLLAGAIVAFPVAVALHNIVSGLTGLDEPVFFLVAVIVAPLALVASAVGTLVTVLWAEVGQGPRWSGSP